jgi:hypothetical protein
VARSDSLNLECRHQRDFDVLVVGLQYNSVNRGKGAAAMGTKLLGVTPNAHCERCASPQDEGMAGVSVCACDRGVCGCDGVNCEAAAPS